MLCVRTTDFLGRTKHSNHVPRELKTRTWLGRVPGYRGNASVCRVTQLISLFFIIYLFIFLWGEGGGTELCSLSTLKQNSVTLWLWVSHSGVIITYGHKIPSLPKLF